MSGDDPLVAVGRVRSVQMARRELRVAVTEDCMRHFDGVRWLWIAAPGLKPSGLGRSTVRCRVESVRLADESSLIVMLSPGVPRDWVALMKGGEARLPKSQLRPPSAEDYSANDLQGMAVAEGGETIGVIIRAYDNGAYAVAEIELRNGARGALPLAGPVVESVDFAEGVVHVRDASDRMVLDRMPQS